MKRIEEAERLKETAASAGIENHTNYNAVTPLRKKM